MKSALHWRPAISGMTVFLISLFIIGGIFWKHLFGLGTFIGESDRLNSYLNIRLWEYDAFEKFGYVPNWATTMFGGFPSSSLHWINPGKDPISFILRIFEREDVFRVLGYFTIGSVVLASTTAFFYFRTLVTSNAVAFLSALSYALSVISIHRASQVDNAHWTLVLLPLVFLAINYILHVWGFVLLTVSLCVLSFLGFLQEAAYSYIFGGCYLLFVSIRTYRYSRKRALFMLLAFGTSAFCALLFSAPRLLDVGKEMAQLSRTTAFHYYGYLEILRFFHEGIFGRTFEENRAVLGNGMNVHEGLQLASSSAFITVIILGLYLVKNLTGRFVVILLVSLFSPLLLLVFLPINFIVNELTWIFVFAFFFQALPYIFLSAFSAFHKRHFFSSIKSPSPRLATLASIGIAAVVIVAFPQLRPSEPITHEGRWAFAFMAFIALLLILKFKRKLINFGFLQNNSFGTTKLYRDEAFHLFALPILLFLILTPDGYRLVYHAFGGADFTHSRLSVVLIFTVCSIFAYSLQRFYSMFNLANFRLRPAIVLPAFCLSLTGFLLGWLINSSLSDQLLRYLDIGVSIGGNRASLSVLIRLFLTVALAASALWVLISRHSHSTKLFAFVFLYSVVAAETIAYSHFKVAGPQTWSYPVPFKNFTYFNTPRHVMVPPNIDQRKSFSNVFETEAYRFVLRGGDVRFDGSKTAFVTSFWDANSIGGYGTGVPARLAMLPWPAKTQTLRTVELQFDSEVSPFLLAFLNVKYIIENNKTVYFNVHDASSGAELIATIEEVEKTIPFTVNPVGSLPRHFLVNGIRGVENPPIFLIKPAPRDAALPTDRVIIDAEHINDLKSVSFAEGFLGSSSFDVSGPLEVQYNGDEIRIEVEPSKKERFIVLNMRFHPDWRAIHPRSTARPYPVNLTMMGFVVPPNASNLLLRFEPLSSRFIPRVAMVVSVLIFAASLVVLLRNSRGKNKLVEADQ